MTFWEEQELTLLAVERHGVDRGVAGEAHGLTGGHLGRERVDDVQLADDLPAEVLDREAAPGGRVPRWSWTMTSTRRLGSRWAIRASAGVTLTG